ncbi:hypothetical protein [Streptomyces sp. NPDC001388]|uniref:hypothetical protein n=1 Tax=unclassified Streptomyces TaxID=2593676 RepID=UPI0036A81362
MELVREAPRVARALVDVVTGARPEKGLEKLRDELTAALNSRPCRPESLARRVEPVPGVPQMVVGEAAASLSFDGRPRAFDRGGFDAVLSRVDVLPDDMAPAADEPHLVFGDFGEPAEGDPAPGDLPQAEGPDRSGHLDIGI